MSSNRLGRAAKLYRVPLVLGVEGTEVEVENVKDLTLNLSTNEADVSTRESDAFVESAAVSLTGEVTFQMQLPAEGTADVNIDAISDAYFARTTVRMIVLDGDIDVDGNEGIKSDFTITNFSKGQPLEGVQLIDITMKPSANTSQYQTSEES